MLALSDGTVLQGELHPSLTVQQAGTLVGRTLDLESAAGPNSQGLALGRSALRQEPVRWE